MVPAGEFREDIIVLPLARREVEVSQTFVLRLGVPTSIGIELAVGHKDAVASATDLGRSLFLLLLVLLPGLSRNVKAVDVVVCKALVAETTVTAVDVNFAIVVAGAAVCAGSWGADGRLLVGIDILAAIDALPDALSALDFEPPTVVEAARRGRVATVDEEAVRLLRVILLRGVDGDVLGSRHGLVAFKVFLGPSSPG